VRVGVRKGLPSLIGLAVVLVSLLMTAPADAQAPAPAPGPVPAEAEPQATRDLDWLISVLQDDARRAALLDALKARGGDAATHVEPKPEPEPKAEVLVVSLSQQVREASERALRFAASIAELPSLVAHEFRQFRNAEIRAQRLDSLWRVLVALGAAAAVEWLCGLLLFRVHIRFDLSTPVTVVGRLVALILRAFVDAIPVGAFIATSVVALGLLETPDRARLAAILLIYAHMSVRAAMIVTRVLVAPGTPSLRLFAFNDETAQYLYIWIRRLAVIGIYGIFITEATRFFGVTLVAREGMFKAIGALFTLLLIIIVLQNRSAMSRIIAYDGASALLGVRKALADVWHILAILYLVGLFGVWLFDVRGGFEYLAHASLGTLLIIGSAWLLIGVMKRIVAHAFRLNPDVTWRFPSLEARANRYLPIFRDAVRLVIWTLAILLILQVWGVHSLQWLSSEPGVRVVGTLVAIGLVLLIALVVWETFAMALERYAARLAARGSGGARARTLLPLFRTAAFAVLTVLAGLVILTQIGVNITPLLAGAGVVGLAIGFGSQKLVQDVINGIFMLIEDTISVGDVVDLDGGHAGVVEAISIRTIHLRDGNGTVHTIPFSEVKTVKNMTRDFAKGVFEVEVDYHENVDRVIDAMKVVGDAISKDKTYAPSIIEPFSMIGVDKVKGSGVVVLGQISTLPGKQWDISRAYNRALKKKFDELGIEMPTGKTSIYVQGAGNEDPTQGRTAPDASPAPSRSGDGR
jgi:small-conductance mechanosensitive channel